MPDIPNSPDKLQPVERLQGTDGVRGPVRFAVDCMQKDPLAVFLREGFLNEEFFELYTYAFCSNLLESGLAEVGDATVVGWDTRDHSGVFNKAALHGVRKAGLTAVDVGVMPTPAVALYLLHREAVCAFVLTASHNPADQNGIKIFLGNTGLKLFPEDDRRLTRTCFETDFNRLKSAPLVGEHLDENASAHKCFREYMQEPFNSWLTVDALDDTTLVLDAANGAFSPIIRETIANLFSVGNFVFTKTGSRGGINESCGVAELEGHSLISPESIETGSFAENQPLKRLLKEGRKQRAELKKGNGVVLGLTLDGDGDRGFLLVYDPLSDHVTVLNGDGLSLLHTEWLKMHHPPGKLPLYVNTVESDLEAGRKAQQSGFAVTQCAVGDKWILWLALMHDWEKRASLFRKKLQDPPFEMMLDNVEKNIKSMQLHSNFNALELTLLMRKVENEFARKKGEKVLQRIHSQCAEIGHSRFTIGVEESGHLINLGRMQCGPSRVRPTYVGNGLKTGLNGLAALLGLRRRTRESFYSRISLLFPSGYRKTLPVYHVDKSLLEPGSDFRITFRETVRLLMEKEGKTVEWITRAEEPQMMLAAHREGELPVFCLFIRNSGTEDKLSLYLRGIKQDEPFLKHLGETCYRLLLRTAKDLKKPTAEAEHLLLKQFLDAPRKFEELKWPENLNFSRKQIFMQMHSRQPLLKKNGPAYEITEWGRVCVQDRIKI